MIHAPIWDLFEILPPLDPALRETHLAAVVTNGDTNRREETRGRVPAKLLLPLPCNLR